MKAMLLAAGLGTRFRPQSDILPKPAMPFFQLPMVLYPAYLAIRMQASSICINTHHLAHKMEESIQRYSEKLPPIHISNEEGELLGRGGGIKKAQKYLEGDNEFIVCNGDEIILPATTDELDNFLKLHKSGDHISTLFCMEHPEVGNKFGGVWVDEDDFVVGFGKQKIQGSVKAYHYTGLQILKDKIFKYIPEGNSDIFYDNLVNALAKGERVKAYNANCLWHETGNEADFIDAHKMILKQREEFENIWSFLGTINHFLPKELRPSFYYAWEENDFIWDPNGFGDEVSFEDFAILGLNCKLAKNTSIKSSIVSEGTIIDNETNLYQSLKLS